MLHFIGSLAAGSRVKWHGTTNRRLPMLKKLAALAAGLVIAAPALADRGRHEGHHFRHHYSHRPVVVVPAPRVVYAPAPVYYAPAPVYYEPAPVYYAPPPRVVYYAPPAPVYYPPVPHSGISVRLHFPL
jgi:hypothetical protein